MSELRKGQLSSSPNKTKNQRSHTADIGSFSLRSTLITGVDALEVDTLTFNYRKLSDLYRTADKTMTDFKDRAHCLKTDLDRFDDSTHIKLQSYESQTQYELDSNSRDLMTGLANELKVKQSLESQLKDLVNQLTQLKQQVEETSARVSYLEDFCGTRKLK
mmetsp:Transcript_6435/g.11221  ORF Transcript_6435/g.11221 Transcript_6435/m.11221 type:complete len:161 (+) Transcript_6435:133-615(+)